jgi:hypothetical protein
MAPSSSPKDALPVKGKVSQLLLVGFSQTSFQVSSTHWNWPAVRSLEVELKKLQVSKVFLICPLQRILNLVSLDARA